MRSGLLALTLLLAAAQPATARRALPSSPDLGTAEGRCRADEPGPAILITAEGLKDRTGTLRAELYPPDDADFLADDNVLLNAGKTFRRVETTLPPSGAVHLCIRAPGPGTYTLSLLHDRDGNRKFGLMTDGIGFPGNPALHWAKPPASVARIAVGPAITRTTIVLNYRHGLLSFGPIGGTR